MIPSPGSTAQYDESSSTLHGFLVVLFILSFAFAILFNFGGAPDIVRYVPSLWRRGFDDIRRQPDAVEAATADGSRRDRPDPARLCRTAFGVQVVFGNSTS